MNPVRFGTARREMTGFYHSAAQTAARSPAVLICNPFGPEAIRSHRMLRLFADRLALAGCPVLRFDYFGTGDSPGDDESASLLGWTGDIGTAHRELLARSGKSSVAWLGVRLGGSLCALAAQSLRAPLESLVLWDPVIDGLAYLATLAERPELLNEGEVSKFDVDTPIEFMGFALPNSFKNELRNLNLSTLSSFVATRSTIILSSETPAATRWQKTLLPSLAKVQWCVSKADAGWTSDKAMNAGVIPMDALRMVESRLLESG